MPGLLGSLVDVMLRDMSMANERSIFITDPQREARAPDPQKTSFSRPGLFSFEPDGTVYSLVNTLGDDSGTVGLAWNALRERFCRKRADRLLALDLRNADQPAGSDDRGGV